MEHNFKVDFIGIGAQKSATTWIAKCLSEHPEICVGEGKETHFFSDDKKFNQGINFYKGCFPFCKDKDIIGEYSTSYLSSPKASERIKHLFPKVKLMVCLRNPVDRAFSHYLHLKSKKSVEKNVPLRETIKRHPDIIENGRYGKYLEHYLNLFSRNQFLILFYEDIEKNPHNFIKKIYHFLEVDENFIPKGVDKKYHTSIVRFSPSYKKFEELYFALKKNVMGRLMMKTAKFFGLDSYLVNDFINKFNRLKFSLSREDRKYLSSLYKEDIQKLEGLINKDLKFW